MCGNILTNGPHVVKRADIKDRESNKQNALKLSLESRLTHLLVCEISLGNTKSVTQLTIYCLPSWPIRPLDQGFWSVPRPTGIIKH